MLRILIVLLASSDALAIMPSSKPALQPVSMHKRIQSLLHNPSRSALADVLHGPYPPDALPAYKRAVHLLIVGFICWMHMMYMRLPEWLGHANHLLLEGLDHPLQAALLQDAWLQLRVRLSHHWHAHARYIHHQRHKHHDFDLRLRAGHSIHTSLMKHFSRVPQQLSHLLHRVQAHGIVCDV